MVDVDAGGVIAESTVALPVAEGVVVTVPVELTVAVVVLEELLVVVVVVVVVVVGTTYFKAYACE